VNDRRAGTRAGVLVDGTVVDVVVVGAVAVAVAPATSA
jgi:hypothetical protein